MDVTDGTQAREPNRPGPGPAGSPMVGLNESWMAWNEQQMQLMRQAIQALVAELWIGNEEIKQALQSQGRDELLVRLGLT